MSTANDLPLAALRVFDVAARTMSFQRAAQELELTPSAVSHQIQKLERRLERRLFVRGRRGVELTDVGRAYASEVIASFDRLRTATARIDHERAALRLSAAPVFAHKYLLPNLDDFERHHPSVRLRVDVGLTLADLARNEADVGVRFGKGEWPGLFCTRLLPIEAGVVCAPHHLDVAATAAQVAEGVVLGISATPGAWAQWFAAAGAPRLRPRREVSFDALGPVLEAAREGRGAALVPLALVEDDLASGRLVQIGTVTVRPPNLGYHVVCRDGEQRTPNVRALLTWLLNIVARAGRERSRSRVTMPR